jgi:hypothetical protein
LWAYQDLNLGPHPEVPAQLVELLRHMAGDRQRLRGSAGDLGRELHRQQAADVLAQAQLTVQMISIQVNDSRQVQRKGAGAATSLVLRI